MNNDQTDETNKLPSHGIDGDTKVETEFKGSGPKAGPNKTTTCDITPVKGT